MLVIGPSGSGKTTWVIQLLKHIGQIAEKPPKRIIFYYNVYQDAYDELRGIVHEFREGLPSDADIKALKDDAPSLVIIDDQMHHVNAELVQIFTGSSRVSGCSLVFMAQSMFLQDARFRVISRQATYMVIMKNPRDNLAIRSLGQQIYPQKPALIARIYADATSKPYSYLFVDLHQQTDSALRLTTNILPNEWPITVYPLPAEQGEEKHNEWYDTESILGK